MDFSKLGAGMISCRNYCNSDITIPFFAYCKVSVEQVEWTSANSAGA